MAEPIKEKATQEKEWLTEHHKALKAAMDALNGHAGPALHMIKERPGIDVELFNVLESIRDRLNAIEIGHLPEASVRELWEEVKKVTELYRAFTKAAPEQAQGLNSQAQGIMRDFWPPVSRAASFEYQLKDKTREFIEGARTEIASIKNVLNSEQAELRGRVEEQIQLTAKDKIEVTDLLEKLKDARLLNVIADHAKHFDSVSKEYLQASRGWLVVTILVLLLTGAFAWQSYVEIDKTLTGMTSIGVGVSGVQEKAGDEIVQQITLYRLLSRLIIFSILGSISVWTSRLYRSNRHNYVVNKHRFSALGTFESFIKAVKADEQTKNALLFQAAQTIFGPQPTGYGKANGDRGYQPQIMEIFRSIQGKPPSEGI